MKKKIWFYPVIVIAFLLQFLAGCKDKFSSEPEDTIITFSEQKSIAENSVTSYQQFLVDNTPQNARSLLVNELKKSNGVSDAGISSDNKTIWWKLFNGVEYCLLTETRASLTDTSSKSLSKSDYKKIENMIYKTSGFPHNNKAMILSPYGWDWNLLGLKPLEDETSFINTILLNAGYNTLFKANENKNDQNISLNDYQNFNQYGVIALSSHGGLTSNDDVMIATGVIATDDLYKQYLDDLTNGNLTLVVYIDKWFTKDDITAFAITPGWMKKFYPNHLDNTLFYAGVSDGLYNNTMANEINGSGSTYFSWSETADTKQCAKTGKDLFTQLVSNGYNCGEAYQKIVENGNGTYDPPFLSSDPTANFLYVGNVELRLVEKPLKIGITPAGFDDIGMLLKSFGYNITVISLSDLLNYSTITAFDIIALNCAGDLEDYASQSKNNLKNFVENGGKLYASDWAYIFIEEAFPDYIDFPAYPQIGDAQTTKAHISDQNLSKYLGVTEAEIVYDLDAWVVIDNVSSSTNVLISGDVSSSGYKSSLISPQTRSSQINKSISSINSVRPLAVSFNYGNGSVVYTTFHNESQINESVRHILEYFTILQ